MSGLNVAMAQLNPTVGAVAANLDKIVSVLSSEATQQSDLVVFAESVLTGYPCEDLIYRPAFLDLVKQQVDRLCQILSGDNRVIVIGAPWRDEDVGQTYNALLFLQNGKLLTTRYKVHLPNDSVFDEKRVFTSGNMPDPVMVKDIPIGFPICEDIWKQDVCEQLVEKGAKLLISPNGSPFHLGKQTRRISLVSDHVRRLQTPFLYINQVGGQDELVFDGASFAISTSEQVICQMPAWQEAVSTVSITFEKNVCQIASQDHVAIDESSEALWSAMVLGLRDYIGKNGFPGVLLGLSGGIDSAIAAAIAVDALGKDKVKCFMMPSPYTSQESLDDAEAVARNLDVELDSLNIGPAMSAFETILQDQFQGTDAGVTEENIQSRSRGLILMALSNKYGSMVLTTGNKSEMAVGYATLYGDMCGGFNVIKDLYKTQVFELCRWRNKNVPQDVFGPTGEVIPERIISKPPTAELRPDQKDEDSLPPYDILDAILYGFIEDQKSRQDLIDQGFEAETVHHVRRLLDLSEYKRRQAPPGVKLSKCAFGKERRYPITNHFRD